PLMSALDVISKLRPDMVAGRMGHPDRIGQHVTTRGARRSPPSQTITRPYVAGSCSGLTNVYVNGKRIPFGPVDAEVRRTTPLNMSETPKFVLDILASIRPEHILELNYVDCMSNATERASAQNSVFVVLKPGVVYVPGVGARIVTDAQSR